MPRFFRRREVWLPTAWGLLVILAAAAGLVVALALGTKPFLAIDAPAATADGRGARVMVVEGWISERDLDQAVSIFRHGHYERVITAGGPIESWSAFKNFADRAADYLRRHDGMRGVPIDAVPSPPTKQDRTFVSAVWVRDWARRGGVRIDSLDVVTADVHARRTRLLYRMAFGPATPVGVLATTPTGSDAVPWWTSSHTFKTTVGEAFSLAWTVCCFWPGPAGSHEERWGVPPAASRPAR